MSFYVTEHCKVLQVKDGIATGTFAIPVELLDEIMTLSSTMLYAARVLKIKSIGVASDMRHKISCLEVKNK